jgi:hypothetical protein
MHADNFFLYKRGKTFLCSENAIQFKSRRGWKSKLERKERRRKSLKGKINMRKRVCE